MIIIYCHTNRITGKSYVGQTVDTMEKRWGAHCRAARHKSSLVFARSIHKHGENVWDHTILEQHEIQKDANEAEGFFIAYLQTLVPNGYNLKSGGGACGKHSKETCEKISLSLRGNKRSCGKRHPHSDDWRRKISESNKGRHNPTDETRKKMSDSHKGQKPSLETRKKRSESLKKVWAARRDLLSSQRTTS
jgi:group I intron endonuclease